MRHSVIATLMSSLLLALVACTNSPGSASSEPSNRPQVTVLPAADTTADAANSLNPEGVRFERLSLEEGLSNVSVMEILQDSRGFMWFGTEDGLNKYDGYAFTVYRNDPDEPGSLRDNYILSMVEDRSGVLWVATRNGWIEKFDRSNDAFTHYGFWPQAPFVSDMLEDQSGVLWIVTSAGLFQFDREAEQLVSQPVPDVLSIHQDGAGKLWFGTRGGLLIVRDGNGDDRRAVELNHGIEVIFEDETGALWLGTRGGGLASVDRDSETMVQYRHDPDVPDSLSDDWVVSICQGPSGALWIGTLSGGLDLLDPTSGRFSHYRHVPGDPYSLSENDIHTVYRDTSEILWVGTTSTGVNMLRTGFADFAHYRHIPNDADSLGSSFVRAIYGDEDGALWVGTRAGLDRFDRQQGTWRHYRHDSRDPTSLSHDLVWSILEDQTGVLWVGTENGLDRYVSETESFVHYPNARIMSMVEDQSETLWLGAEDGVYRFDPTSGNSVLVSEPGVSWVWAILVDDANLLWVGTGFGGLWRYDGQRAQWKQYSNDPNDPHSLADATVFSLHQDRGSQLWIGTRSGLDRMDPATEKFAHFRARDGLANDSVSAILEDNQGSLWISTAGGLSRFDPQSQTFENYDISDGLQSNIFVSAAYQTGEGEMLLGGVNGFNTFYPERIAGDPHIPPVVITAFSLFNEVERTDLLPDEEIVLAHDNNFLSFEFAALDYNDPPRNQYKFMMEGVDEDWIQAGTRRRADYPNLQPGDFTFRVQGSNNDGVWNEEGAAVHITVAPPFWATWWFRGIVALMVVGGAAIGYRVRVRAVETRSRELEIEVAERTAELSSINKRLMQEIAERERVEEALAEERAEAAVLAERSRLARELHDAVTQTLFSASIIAEALPRLWKQDQKKGEERLTRLRQMSRGALAEMRALLLELRPAALMQTSLDDLLRQLGEAVTGREGIRVTVEVDGQCRLPPDVHVALYRIAQEALNNVVKHAQASQALASLRCTLHSSDDEISSGQDEHDWFVVQLTITDDGRGFEPSDVPPHHFGLGIMRERADAIGAQLQVDSSPGQGTRVKVMWTEHKNSGAEGERLEGSSR